jgi:tetratricopeptide (TPR) repeat protein
MKAATRQERRDLVATLPEFRSWALAEQACEASVRAAAHRPEEALDLANLALFIAGRVPGEESWRSRVEGYCWAFVGNARRVDNDFAGADKAFARAWERWKAGAPSDPNLLPEWRLLDLEASLRREQHRFPDALTLLDKAMALKGSDMVIAARILLQKEHVLEQMGDIRGALTALTEATPFVEASGNPRLLFALHFNTADNLCHLGQYERAADRLPQVRKLAVQNSNELDVIRVVWLEARVAAGQERREEAVAGLEQVRQDFTARGLPYDAALVSLDLAVLYLEDRRTVEVRNLARAMSWIFQVQGIAREALAALALFLDAAQRESVTVELTRHIANELQRARASAPPQKRCQRSRG